MRYLSVCSGIEAASVAWHPLGWRPVAFSEIDAFPSAVLAHRYPGVPNLSDMTKFQEWPDATIDLLVGGTPCQSFSVAGLRKGLDDPRGNLMLTFGAIAARYRPRWLVWENVPGVLSSNGGRDFGAFLGLLGVLGYGFAYRVLDAQYVRVDGYARAVLQRRQRVFVVGCLGDWRRAAAVLLEREGLRGDSAPSRAAREGAAAGAVLGAAVSSGQGWWSDSNGVAATIRAQDSVTKADTLAVMAHGQGGAEITAGERSPTLTCNHEAPVLAFSCKDHGADAGPLSPTLRAMGHAGSHANAGGQVAVCVTGDVFHTLRAEGSDASEDGTGRGSGAVAFAIQAGALRTNPSSGPDGVGVQANHAYTIEARAEVQAVAQSSHVRRLTPRECERLQGFPDDWTLVPYRGKPSADGPRYKAIGNSMAVNCMRWIGRRIALGSR